MSSQIDIVYADHFKKQHKALPEEIKKKSAKTVHLFLQNILHPSLRLHKLSGPLRGLWSISINKQYRILLRPLQNNTYLFVSIGTHSIYEKR